MQKNAGDIEERLHTMESVRLFKQPPPQPGYECLEAKVSMDIPFSLPPPPLFCEHKSISDIPSLASGQNLLSIIFCAMPIFGKDKLTSM